MIATQMLWISAVPQLYWVDTGASPQIMSFDFITEEITTVHDSLLAPFDLKILSDDQKLVWNDTLEAVIYMSNLDGSQLEVLMQVENLTPYYFDVDELSERIYCSGLNSEYVFVADYYSSSVETVFDSGGPSLSSVAFHPDLNTVAVTRSDHYLELLDLNSELVSTLDISVLLGSDPNSGSESIGEIKATDSTNPGFYFLFDGTLYKILDGDQPEQLSLNSEAYEFFAFSSEPDRLYAGAGNVNTIMRHQDLLFGEPDFSELQGQILIEEHYALGMDIFESEPTSHTEIHGLDYLSLYPNPVDTYFTIESQDPIKDLRIFDVCGQLIFQASSSDQNRLTIDFSDIAEGYYVAVIIQDGSYSSKFFSKN